MLTIKYFTAKWCGPCKAFGPVIDKVSNDIGVNVTKIDVDENKALTQEYFISSVPTLIFELDGKAMDRKTGALSYHQLVSLVNNYNK
jgi:thioredoxin